MLSFVPKKVDQDTLLNNANTLLDFNPSDTENNNALKIDAKGQIVLCHRSLIAASATPKAASASTLKKDFLQESLILLWQASQFLSWMQGRFEALKKEPKDDLNLYYQHVINIHGLYQLSHNFFSQLDNFRNQIDHFHSLKKNDGDFLFTLANCHIKNDWESIEATAEEFKKTIKEYRIKLLGNLKTNNLFILTPMGMIFLHSTQVEPLQFNMGQFNFGDSDYKISMAYDIDLAKFEKPTSNPFTGNFLMSLSNSQDAEVHGSMFLYPSWEAVSMAPITLKGFMQAQDGATAKLRKDCENERYGAIALLRKPELKVAFTHFCDHMFEREFVPYFMCIISAAKLQKFAGVTFYAPYSFSAIALSCGFTSQDSDSPTIGEQRAVIEEAMDTGTLVPQQKHLDRHNEEGEILLRAFHLDLVDVHTKPVFFTQKKLQTTYPDLLENNETFDAKKYPQGIIPEINKAPLTFSAKLQKFSLYKFLEEREMGAKTRLPAVYLAERSIDYRLMTTSEGLASYALSDKEVAKKSGYTKQLILKRS